MGSYNMVLGTLLVGIFFNTYLYGLVTYQFAAYYRTQSNDRTTTKYIVLFLFVLDTFHSVSEIYMAWYYTVENFENPAALAVALWPHTITPLTIALAALVTQIYLGLSILRLTNSKMLFAVVLILAIPSYVLAVTCSVLASMIKVMTKLPCLTPIVVAWLSMQVMVDAYNTITLIIIYSRLRTSFCKTDTILSRLIRGAIQTGLFAGLFAIADLISFVIFPDTSLYIMFAIPLGRIYTNTFLDVLLTRESIKAEISDMRALDSSSSRLTSRIAVPLDLT